MGASGSGKSTLMNLIGCLDRPTRGSYRLKGKDVAQLSKVQLAHIRNRLIGFVFQGFNLLARTSAIENVELPLVYSGVPHLQRSERARQALAHYNRAIDRLKVGDWAGFGADLDALRPLLEELSRQAPLR